MISYKTKECRMGVVRPKIKKAKKGQYPTFEEGFYPG